MLDNRVAGDTLASLILEHLPATFPETTVKSTGNLQAALVKHTLRSTLSVQDHVDTSNGEWLVVANLINNRHLYSFRRLPFERSCRSTCSRNLLLISNLGIFSVQR